jgi:ADP-ribose pyrophosphatase YjhB (NUDIX family)
MHYIQKHILDELRTKKTIRYSQLNTDRIESSHFRYHLGQLVKAAYVEQLERGVYSLTVKGQQYVDTLSDGAVNPESMPKVITYTLLRSGHKVLLQEKHKQPYMALLNMIGGKLHYGELAQDAAVREIHEKTGKTIAPPQLAGTFEILIKKSGIVFTHTIAYVFVAEVNIDDWDSSPTEAIDESELHLRNNLAPDFMFMFSKITTSTQPYVGSLEIEI